MHLNPSKTSLSRLCFRTRLALCRKENKAIKSFEGSFRNLNFSPSTSILLNFFFPFIDIRCFFSSLKLQYCRTIVLPRNLFFKNDNSHAISRQEKRGCPKALHDFPPRKDGILHPRSGCLGTSLPLPQSLYGRTDGRTLTSQPTFFRSISYQICLAMELRWRALPAGSAIIYLAFLTGLCTFQIRTKTWMMKIVRKLPNKI